MKKVIKEVGFGWILDLIKKVIDNKNINSVKFKIYGTITVQVTTLLLNKFNKETLKIILVVY